MKKLLFSFAIASLIVGCASNPEGVEAETKSAQEVSAAEGIAYQVDVAGSKIEWTGAKVSGKHNGTINLSEGTVYLKDNQLSGGSFVVDMNSIVDLDITDPEYNGKLVGHLKSDDFFAVDKYPTAKFEITGVTPAEEGKLNISGNLTLRDTTNNISFVADVVESSESRFEAKADFNINRKKWNVLYNGIADDLIADEINFKVHLVANKQ